MAMRVVCPMCRRKIRVPEHLAGKRVTCPRCQEPLRAPAWGGAAADLSAAGSVPGTAAAQTVGTLPLSSRLGVVALMLGLSAVLILCLPVIGYAALGLSTIGLVLGLGGLVQSLTERGRHRGGAGGVTAALPLGTHPAIFPLAGTGVCLVALTLTLLPWLFR